MNWLEKTHNNMRLSSIFGDEIDQELLTPYEFNIYLDRSSIEIKLRTTQTPKNFPKAWNPAHKNISFTLYAQLISKLTAEKNDSEFSYFRIFELDGEFHIEMQNNDYYLSVICRDISVRDINQF